MCKQFYKTNDCLVSNLLPQVWHLTLVVGPRTFLQGLVLFLVWLIQRIAKLLDYLEMSGTTTFRQTGVPGVPGVLKSVLASWALHHTGSGCRDRLRGLTLTFADLGLGWAWTGDFRLTAGFVAS